MSTSTTQLVNTVYQLTPSPYDADSEQDRTSVSLTRPGGAPDGELPAQVHDVPLTPKEQDTLHHAYRASTTVVVRPGAIPQIATDSPRGVRQNNLVPHLSDHMHLPVDAYPLVVCKELSVPVGPRATKRIKNILDLGIICVPDLKYDSPTGSTFTNLSTPGSRSDPLDEIFPKPTSSSYPHTSLLQVVCMFLLRTALHAMVKPSYVRREQVAFAAYVVYAALAYFGAGPPEFRFPCNDWDEWFLELLAIPQNDGPRRTLTRLQWLHRQFDIYLIFTTVLFLCHGFMVLLGIESRFHAAVGIQRMITSL